MEGCNSQGRMVESGVSTSDSNEKTCTGFERPRKLDGLRLRPMRLRDG